MAGIGGVPGGGNSVYTTQQTQQTQEANNTPPVETKAQDKDQSMLESVGDAVKKMYSNGFERGGSKGNKYIGTHTIGVRG